MKTNLLILVAAILLSGCSKHEDTSKGDFYAKTYIKNLVPVDTANAYKGNYYIHVSYTDLVTSEKKELTFDETAYNMITLYNPSEYNSVMSVQGASFWNYKEVEKLEIAFYINTFPDSTFKICYADYIFGNPWRVTAGANIEYFKIGSNTDPNSYFMYQGINKPDSYFKITYIGYNRINGVFHTIWNENYTEKSIYDVEGDFSIPRIRP